MFPPTRTLLHTSRESSSSSSSFWCLIGNGGMIQRIQSISSTYLHKRDQNLPPHLTYMLMIIGTWTYLVNGSRSATPLTTTLTGIITSTYLHKGIYICHPLWLINLYVDDNKNMNLSCWGIKIHHPLWLLRWQGSLHQLIFPRDQNLQSPLTYMLMIIRTWTYPVSGSKSITPSDYYVNRDHYINLSS